MTSDDLDTWRDIDVIEDAELESDISFAQNNDPLAQNR